jgi:lysozyme
MTLLSKCAEFTSKFEGCRLEAYQDSVGVWTIGFGSTHEVVPHMQITQSQALEWLERDLNASYNAVQRLIKTNLSDDQYIALIDFVYNLGAGTLQRSTLRARLNRGDMDCQNEFLKYNKAGGRPLRGLTIRRQAEVKLWLKH